MLKKIAIVGPESTGKSTIAQTIAQYFHTVCVPEYAREYCKDLANTYTLQDEINMFHGQIALENSLIPLAYNNLIICDTTILTVKIWCDYLFEKTPTHVIEEIKNHPYDLYLLMNIDLPWQDDPLRDFPEQRAYFMQIWKNELDRIDANYIIISGSGEERIQAGIRSCEAYLLSQNKSKT